MNAIPKDRVDWGEGMKVLGNYQCQSVQLIMHYIMPYANNKGADQPAHPRSLISAFVVRCLDSIIPLLAIAEISRL